jgi:hypothetical protein
MVDGLHILIWNRTKKPLVIALIGAGRGVEGSNSGIDTTNVQYKSIWNCLNETTPVQRIYLNKKLT